MIYRDWRFLSALGLTISQQILLALSTFYIARAGQTLESGDVRKILLYVSLFFTYALLGYVSSSAASFFNTRAANEAWKKYTNTTLVCSTENLQQASQNNKKMVAQWLGGEASSTIGYACGFYLGFVSVALNVIFTLLVFYISVGWEITLAMATSLAISLVFVMILRRRIEGAAGDMQSQKLKALLSVELAWNSAMFGSKKMRDTGFHNLNEKYGSYFHVLNKYVLLEQLVACVPIVISTVAVIALIQYSTIFTLAVVGTLVAVLPRSLQVFGNVHSLSIYISQFYMMRTKLRNLKNFTSRLDKYHLMFSMSLKNIKIRKHSADKDIQPEEILECLRKGTISPGRYTVTGRNGSGKSSFLKIVKSIIDDSILITPETNFLDASSDLSTGELKIKELDNVLLLRPHILMLDEWDANLDESNFSKINMLLEDASRQAVIIEVRHLPYS